ncbi:Curli production assembly/transport component CsgG [Flavobacteriaceae bacterium]|jgi:hypothetical protein|nr:Curli production assembly/transport component CsgG [Flavobacteriaceae bacterium]
MTSNYFWRLIFITLLFIISNYSAAQAQEDVFAKASKRLIHQNDLRGKNAFSVGIGTSIMNGDFNNPISELYYHVGYKRFLGSSFAINFGFHKFNLAFKDVFNEGFMSYDVNLEWYLSPAKKLSPFVYGGAGYHAANYFETNEVKLQCGVGFEYLLTERVGMKFFGDYNRLKTDDVEGLIFGKSDDTYWRFAIGLNIYFGNYLALGKHQKNIPTIINSNQLSEDYK